MMTKFTRHGQLQDVKLTLSPTAIKGLYSFGYRFFHEGQFEKAAHFFRMLTCFASEEPKIWKALGSSLQMLQQYEPAAEAFATAALLNDRDPFTHLHGAECLFALKKWESAEEALISVEESCVGYDQEDLLLDQVSLLRTIWKDHLNEEAD